MGDISIKGKSPILNKKADLDKKADQKLITIALQHGSFEPITGAYPKMVDGKKTKRTTRSRQAADFNHPRGFRLPDSKFGNPKAGTRKK